MLYLYNTQVILKEKDLLVLLFAISGHNAIELIAANTQSHQTARIHLYPTLRKDQTSET